MLELLNVKYNASHGFYLELFQFLHEQVRLIFLVNLVAQELVYPSVYMFSS